jgi:GNAT superfamily N-acetyltransferase
MTRIVLIDDPDGRQRQLFDDWADVFAADGHDQFGDDHAAWTADELRETGRSTDRPRISWAAVDGDGTVVGSAGLVLPQHDNLTMANLIAVVHPEHRRRGLGSELVDLLEAAALERGRTLFLAETQWPVGARDESGEDFAAGRGYAGAQTVLRSTLTLPAEDARLGAALAGDGSDGYVTRTFWDGIPQEWLDGRAELSRRMSTEVPLGDLQLEEESWDADRVAAEYARMAAMGRRVVDTFAVEEASGALVGFTQVQVPRDDPAVAFQQDTLVLPEHRGHGLGLRMKAATARALEQGSPATSAIRTWNADDNTAMLAVNDALGFVRDAFLREWQKGQA